MMMAEKNVGEFIEEVRNSANLQNKLEALQASCGNDLLLLYVKLAQDIGYEFTEAQLQAELEARSTQMVPEGPLSDEQLEAVAGGAGCPWCMFTDGSYCFFTK
jgi:predicted ribosomally synthesized peptide with nif11-like leader